MLIRIKKRSDVSSSEITPESLYLRRREFMVAGAGALTAAALGLAGCGGEGETPTATGQAQNTAPAAGPSPLVDVPAPAAPPDPAAPRFLTNLDELRTLEHVRMTAYDTDEPLNSFQDIAHYNNYYEYGASKSDPANYAPSRLQVAPWSVEIAGECERPGVIALEDLLAPHTFEERIYRLRCVEAWSMVIPWLGIPMANVLHRFEPTSRARYVEFLTLSDDRQLPDLRRSGEDRPYTEALRIDEAMHPLTMLVVGLYGKELPAQNGAPLRLLVPWKYGFKSGKSIVRIRFTEERPLNTWQRIAPQEYGFYANVNPQVNHPRWSQATERRLGVGFLGLGETRATLMFNGYADEVAHLYAGMDLSTRANW